MNKNFNKILIIGLGLIGGSFAKSCRKNQVCEEIYASDLNKNSLENAKKFGVIDDFIELDNVTSDFDLVVISSPLSSYKEIIKKIVNKISSNTILIDLGSIKDLKVIKEILPKNLSKNFVLCHPIAGSEKTGFENSIDNLFLDKKFIICPENCDELAIKKVEDLAKKIGAKTEFLSAKEHDKIYALISHLPQFLSFLTKEFSPKEIKDEFFTKAFRLDNSDPEIWFDIFKLNQQNIEKYYLEFFDNLADFMEDIAVLHKNHDSLKKILSFVSKCSSFVIPSSFVMSSKDGIYNDSQYSMDPVIRRGNKVGVMGDKVETIGDKMEVMDDSMEIQNEKTDLNLNKEFLTINEEFVTKNFAAIFLRAIIVMSYLKIKDIEKFRSFSGSGFKDFTSIITILTLENNLLTNLIKKNQKEILKIFETLI